ncbi:ABC transporter permease [Paenibacillus thermotolerans]|uniref:ABC transporter permease n=1 Tax=Paenibacillus thermotolerans TaxID=3027807 RepID=UPI00236828FD|nr:MULTISPECIES: ABC transporter permease [unclassified Paenibacillus]
MVNLLFTEILKLKRSRMFLLSMIGAAVAPFMVVIASSIDTELREPVLFAELFAQTNLYVTLLIGVPLYGVVTAYVFNREYAEDTLKNLLTLPVSRISIMASKMLLLFLWIMLLTVLAWGLTLALGLIGRFGGFGTGLMWEAFRQFMTAGALLFVLSTPIVLTSVVMKNYVPSIVLSIVITLINVMGYNSDRRGLIPWTAAMDIANGALFPRYPAFYSYASIAATSLICFIAAITYFRKADI